MLVSKTTLGISMELELKLFCLDSRGGGGGGGGGGVEGGLRGRGGGGGGCQSRNISLYFPETPDFAFYSY